MAKIQFDIKYKPQIESGEYRVETQAGCPVRIVCWDMACEFPILGLVLLNDEKAEEVAVGFTNEGANLLGEPLCDKLFIVTTEEELTPFENRLCEILDSAINYQIHSTHEKTIEDAKKLAPELLAIAREQFIKEGYVIEKKAFHDAVENISDKHRAEMSVEYSLHCKIEEGTRHAIMNWEAFQKVAQKFIDIGKAEALRTRAIELTENLVKSGLDKDSIPYHLIEFMCNLYDCQNWKEIEGSAELYVTRIKAAAMKGVPRWKKAAGYWFVGQSFMCDELGFYKSSTTKPGCRYITYESLRMLPGFNE